MTTRPLLLGEPQAPVGFDDWQKTAGTRLSNDARMWVAEVTAQIAAAHPYIPAESLGVEFNRLDPVKGAAVGSASVGDTGVTIPVIIKRARVGGDPELMPTDIFYAEGRYLPLTAEGVKSAMQSREFGTPMPNPQANRVNGANPYVGDVTGDASPLEYAGQSTPYAGPFASKTSEVIEKIAGIFSKKSMNGYYGNAGGYLDIDKRTLTIGHPEHFKDAKQYNMHMYDRKEVDKRKDLFGKKFYIHHDGRITPEGKKEKTASIRAGIDAPSVRELTADVEFDKTAAMAGTLKTMASGAGAKANKAVEGLLTKIRALPPEGKAAVIGGTVGATVGAGKGFVTGNGVAKGAVGGAATGAASSALGTHLYRKIGSLCERLTKEAGAIHPNDLANFRALLATNPQVLQGAAATNLQMVDLILKHKGPGQMVQGSKVTRPNIMVLTRDPMTGFTRVKFTGGPSEVIRDEHELKTLLGPRLREAKDALMNHGMYMITEDIQQVSWDANRQIESGAKPVERDGLYAIRDRNGGTILGHVIMSMMQPNGMSVPMRLFIGQNGEYAVATELFGVRLSDRNRVASTAAKKGEHGVFITYVNGTPLATTPLIMDSIGRLTSDIGDGVKDSDFVVYNVTNPVNGEQMALVPTRAVQGFMRVREIDPTKMTLTRGDIYLMPADVQWVRFSGRADVAKDADQVVKISHETTDVTWAHGTDRYHVRQKDQTWLNLENIDAAEKLASMGMDKVEAIVDVLKIARTSDDYTVKIKGLHEPHGTEHTVKVAEDKTFPLMERLMADMKPSAHLLKVAAQADDQALDIMLGLNFITPKNVRVFTDSIDQFDEVASKLASLLLASRLGLQHVKEDAVKEAMEGIARTSEYLRLLQSASQFQRQQPQAQST